VLTSEVLSLRGPAKTLSAWRAERPVDNDRLIMARSLMEDREYASCTSTRKRTHYIIFVTSFLLWRKYIFSTFNSKKIVKEAEYGRMKRAMPSAEVALVQ
jgi:hypothetical protein